MSYFDNPERRAAWEKELAALKKEKEAGMCGVAASRTEKISAEETEKSAKKSSPFRIRMSYVQLLREESMTAKAGVTKKVPQKELEKDVQLEK